MYSRPFFLVCRPTVSIAASPSLCVHGPVSKKPLCIQTCRMSPPRNNFILVWFLPQVTSLQQCHIPEFCELGFRCNFLLHVWGDISTHHTHKLNCLNNRTGKAPGFALSAIFRGSIQHSSDRPYKRARLYAVSSFSF